MGSIISIAQKSATIFTDSIAAQVADSRDISCEKAWFVSLLRTLYPKDAGFALHVLTGFEERTCYRYAAGDTNPTIHFLRALLRSEHGGQVLAAVMDGATPQWWKDLELARELAAVLAKCK